MRRRRLLIVNINREAKILEGCRAIRRAVRGVDPELAVSVRHWRDVDRALIARTRPGAVIIGPNETPFPAYPRAFDQFLAWLRRRRGPTMGICGGHQALALAHGCPVGPVFAVPAATSSYDGMPKVCGASTIRLLGDPDPLLEGLASEVRVFARHVDEVKEVPPGFRLLAIGDPSPIQIIGAERRPVYGVQFHPERRVPGGAGPRIMENFVAMVR